MQQKNREPRPRLKDCKRMKHYREQEFRHADILRLAALQTEHNLRKRGISLSDTSLTASALMHRTDGCGRKPMFQQMFAPALGAHIIGNAVGDAIAMGDDVVRDCGVPLACFFTLERGGLSFEVTYSLAQGYLAFADMAGIKIEPDSCESAYSKEQVGGHGDAPFMLTASVWGIKTPKIDTYARIKMEQPVVALSEDGYGVNGGGTILKALRREFGDKFYRNKNLIKHGDVVQGITRPSAIYAPWIVYAVGDIHEKARLKSTVYPNISAITGMVHLTHGSFPSRVSHMLKNTDRGMYLHDLFPPPTFLKKIKEWGALSSQAFYRTFGAGQRFLIVLENEERANAFLDLIEEYNKIEERKAEEFTINYGFRRPSHRVSGKICGHVIDIPWTIVEDKSGDGREKPIAYPIPFNV